MYQWVEYITSNPCHSRCLGYMKKSASYNKEWRSQFIPSNIFRQTNVDDPSITTNNEELNSSTPNNN